MKHLDEVGETYLRHAKAAGTIACKFLFAGVCQAIHAIVPEFHPPCGTDLESMVGVMTYYLPKHRKARKNYSEDDLYTTYGGD
jgi:hypothetical protein